jgi:hypothetical protein
MDFIKTNKSMIIAIIAIILLAIGGYFVLNNKKVPESTNLLANSSSSSGGPLLDPKLLSALSQLRLVKLDLTLFKSPIFKSLEDFSVEIEPQPFGRPNPFAPLGDIEDIDLGDE